MSVAGSVAEIWRYPVKSMGGERLAQSAIAARGLHADRMWAVRDAELDTFTTARPQARPTGPRDPPRTGRCTAAERANDARL